MITDGRTSIQ
jgi:hypothetical protein